MDTVQRLTRSSAPVTAFVALSVASALQAMRVLLPVAYSYREAHGLQNAALIGVVVFLAPALVPLLVRLVGQPGALLLTAGAVAGAWLAVQAVHPVPIALAAVFTAVALMAVAAAIGAGRDERPALAIGVVAGLVLDTALRAAWVTWDGVWRDGSLPWAVAIAGVAALLLAAAGSARRARRDAVPSTVFSVGLAIGPFLALQVLLLQNPPFVDAAGHVALSTGTVVVLLGDAVAAFAVGAAARLPVARSTISVATLGLAVLVWLATDATSTSAIAVLVAAQLLATLLFARVCLAAGPGRRAPWRDAVGLGAGSLFMGLCIVGYQVHYDRPLPFSNRWLPTAAAVALGAVALVVASPARADAGPMTRPVRWLAAGAAVVAMSLGFGLAVSEPTLATAPVPRLTVMTYNVHDAVTRHGSLDPSTLARVVRGARPDVVVVEEAGRGWPLSAGIDLAEWAKRELGMSYVWAPAANQQFGNVLFSRVPIHSARVVALPPAPGRMNRSGVVAEVGPVAGRLVTVAGAHLQEGTSPDRVRARIRELHVLLGAVRDPEHAVVLGDFNSDPGSPELSVLLDAGYTTTQPTERCTLKTSNRNCVDWIFVGPGMAQNQVRALHVDAYDHRPLIAGVTPSS